MATRAATRIALSAAKAAPNLREVPKVAPAAKGSGSGFWNGKMRPPLDVAPLGIAVAIGCGASFVVGYSTLTRDGSDVLVNKDVTESKHYYDGVDARKEAPPTRNPMASERVRS